MTCPLCEVTADPAAQIGAVVVCAHCGASLVLEEGYAARRATAADTTGLSPADLQTLRKARGRTR